MANYDRLELLETERAELERCKRMLPFREWFAVKAINQECRYFDTKRRMMAYVRKHFSREFENVRVYQAQ